MLALAVRRLHDIDQSGWWIVAGFIPVVNVAASVAGIVIGLIGAKPSGARSDARPSTIGTRGRPILVTESTLAIENAIS
ncbi:hypothetical protein TSHO111613_15360 [Tsukamurella hominis]